MPIFLFRDGWECPDPPQPQEERRVGGLQGGEAGGDPGRVHAQGGHLQDPGPGRQDICQRRVTASHS